jgi:hypothetical protein
LTQNEDNGLISFVAFPRICEVFAYWCKAPQMSGMEIGELCKTKGHVLSVLPEPSEHSGEKLWSPPYWRWPQRC